MSKKLFAIEIEQEICRLYKQKLSSCEITRKFKCGKSVILGILKRNNIKRREKQGYFIQKYRRDSNYFSLKNKKSEKDYIIGLLIADGCIQKGQLTISLTDKEPVKFMKKELQYNGPIHLIIRNNEKDGCKRKPQWRLSIRDVQIIEDLRKYGMKERKSFDSNFDINWNLIKSKSDFIRGVFDGDGCISINKQYNNLMFLITNASPKFLGNCQKIMIKECKLRKTKLCGKYNKLKIVTRYNLAYGGNTQVRRIYDFLYKDATFWMKRKRDKFEEILKDN